MAMAMITVSGFVAKDPRIGSAGDTPVMNFSVPVQPKKDGPTDWYNCAIFGRRATALSDYIRKGTRVTVSGVLSTSEYEGKTQLRVSVAELDFSNPKRDDAGGFGGDSGGAEPDPF